MDRRTFIQSGIRLGSLAAGAMVSGKFASALAPEAKSSPGATVETTAGKVRGLAQGGVQAFRGVPYGASTAGANRFMPPVKRQPWTNVREAYELGLRAPQRISDFHGQVPPEFDVMCPDEPMGEDCLVLNVWTPGAGAGHKRPVMVWLHGGGYTSGSGGFLCYNGQELARKHDVVVVTVNHRLTVFGYLYFAGIGGEKFAQASNVGMLDIVASLEWVRDNAAAFGGDPGNVTIFGQSGGAGKVSSLMAMPAAKGLFHRAIIESGADLKGVPVEVADKSAEMFLARLNLKADQAGELQKLPMEQLLAAIPPGGGPGSPGLALAPVVDGRTLPAGPFDPTAPEISANIPLLIGTTETEVTFFPNQLLDPIDDAGLHAHIKQLLRRAADDQVEKVIAAYRTGRPGATNTDLYLIIASDATFRAGVVTEAERQAALAKAPVYQYYFTWRSPVRDGKLRSFHTIEIPFVFDNLDAAKSMTGSGPGRQALADKVSGAWVAFARSGNPNHKGLPEWAAFNNTQRATMILDNECKLVSDPHGEEQRLLHSVQSGQG
ncbi:MAG TPA: carboxylesterase family protein [Candidatus Acidoferrales bacterium]|nr:carboxylesterase family protein [Candidatus Acidoferrales bacterium]